MSDATLSYDNVLFCIPIGTPVLIGENIPAQIIGINITGKNTITYKCAWWDNRSYNSLWFYDFEVTLKKGHKFLKVGFYHNK